MCLIFSAITKPDKKLKVNKPAEDPKATDPEKQTIYESSHQTSETALDDPPPEEHHVTTDSMDIIQLMLSRPVVLSRLKKLKV